MKSIIAILFFLTFYLEVYATTPKLDSLVKQLQARQTVDKAYIDLLNAISFEYILAEPLEARSWIKKAVHYSDSINYQKGLIRAIMNQGSSYFTVGLFDQALEYYKQSLAKGADSLDYIRLCNNIGETYRKKEIIDSSFVYFDKALKKTKTISGLNLSMLPANIGDAYLSLKNYDSAEYFFKQSYYGALSSNNLRSKSYALFGLGEIAYERGELTKAFGYHHQALKNREAIDDKRGIIQSLTKLGIYHINAQKLDSAEILLLNAKQIANEFNSRDLLVTVLENLSYLYNQLGKTQEAYDFLLLKQTISDSLETASYKIDINNIKATLSAELNDAQYELLLQDKRKNERSLKIQSMLLILIVVIVFILIYYLNKYYEGLKLAKKYSEELSDLNKLNLKKNDKIKQINERLDQQLITTNRLLSETEKLSKLGGWEYDLGSSKLFWTKEIYRQLGISSKVEPTLSVVKDVIGDVEYRKINLAVKRVIVTGAVQSVKVILNKEQQTALTFSIKLIPEYFRDKLIKIYGSNHDITDTLLHEKKELDIAQSLFTLSTGANLKNTSFTEFIDTVLEEAVNVLGVDRVSFWLYKEEERKLVCMNYFTESDYIYKQGHELREDKFPNYFHHIRSSRTIAAVDARTDDRIKEFAQDYLIPYNVFSILDSRVTLQGEFIGVICFEQANHSVEWTYSETRYAGSIADIVSMAFSYNQTLLLEQEKLNLIDKLLKRNQNLKEFAHMVSHNLKNPVMQILGLSSIYDKPEGEDLKDEIVPRINEAANTLNKVIRDLTIVLRQQDNSTEKVDNITLSESFELAKSSLKTEIKENQAIIVHEFDSAFSLTLQPSVLYNICYNLLSNALKYRRLDVPLSIHLNAYKDEDSTNIQFSDNGKGIDLSRFHDRIFKMYERFHPETDGSGLGLYLVKNQIENFGGSISIKSKPGEGTVFFLKFPHSHHTEAKESLTVIHD